MNNISQDLREIANDISLASHVLHPKNKFIKYSNKLNDLATQLEWLPISEHGNPKENIKYAVTFENTNGVRYVDETYWHEDHFIGVADEIKVIAYRSPYEPYKP